MARAPESGPMEETPAVPLPGKVAADPALRDAAEIGARIAADEAAAAAARDEYRRHGLPELVTDAAPELGPQEQLHAMRPAALVERTKTEGESVGPRSGALWVTSARLICATPEAISTQLEDVDEMTISMGRLLLIRLTDGSGLAIETDQPRLLRVQLAAAIEARRRG